MAAISKDTFNASKGYRRVIIQEDKPIMDFDHNEAHDIILDLQDRIAAQLAEQLNLLGSAGRVTPNVGVSRSVDVSGGIAVHNGTVIRVPSATALKVFNDATTTGIHSSLVYVEWWDTEVTYATDPDIYDPAFGESGARTKRNVVVAVNIGSTDLPAVAPNGGQMFKVAVVTHDFDADGTTIQNGDIAQEPAGITPGELGGYGPARTLRLVSNTGSTVPAFELDTRSSHTGGALLYLSNQGVRKASFDYRGYLALGKATLATEALDVAGNIAVTGTVDGVDISAFKSAYDAHNHDARYYTESEIDAGFYTKTDADNRFANVTGDTFTGIVKVVRDGDAYWFDNTGTLARYILRVFRSGAVRAELAQDAADGLVLYMRQGAAGSETSVRVFTVDNATGVMDFGPVPTVDGETVLLTAVAGAGISVSKSGTQLSVTNSDRGSSQAIFKNVANGSGTTQFSAASNNDAVRFDSSGIISVAFDAATKKVTYSASLAAGTGISVSGSTITNTDRGSSQSIFKNVADGAGTSQFSAGTNNDSLRFASSGIVSVAFDPATKKVTYSASLEAGTGISVSGSTITNSDRGSSQSIFKNVKDAAGTTKFSAGSNNDSVQFGAGGIVSIAFDAANKRVTYSASLSAGTGISVSGSTITNTGIISAAAGSGISVSGTNPLTITNTDRGSAQNIFKNVANGSGTSQFSAGSNNDSIRFDAGTGLTLAFDAATKKVTYAVSLTAGSGISILGATITNSDRGSSQNIFKNVANSSGTTQFSAGSNNDSVRFAVGSGLSVAFDPATKKVTFTNTDLGSTQAIFKNVADSAGTAQFTASSNSDSVRFAAGTGVTVAFDAATKKVTYAVSLLAGSGISISGSTITNSDRGSSQNIFKNIANSSGTTQFSAGSNSDALRFAAGSNISVSFDAATKKITIAGTGTWPNADTVDGYHASAFALASHNHDSRYYTESEADGRFAQLAAVNVFTATSTFLGMQSDRFNYDPTMTVNHHLYVKHQDGGGGSMITLETGWGHKIGISAWGTSTVGDDSLRFHYYNGTSWATRFYLDFQNGYGYADVGWTTFSPTPPKPADQMTVRDWLVWGTEDAKKPVKPYAGIPDENHPEVRRKASARAQARGVSKAAKMDIDAAVQEERETYGKDIAKIAIGSAQALDGLVDALSKALATATSFDEFKAQLAAALA